jgi:hypothetical protein
LSEYFTQISATARGSCGPLPIEAGLASRRRCRVLLVPRWNNFR